MELPATAPFDLARSLAFLSWFPAAAGEQEVAPDALTKALRVDGHTVSVRVTAAPGGVRLEHAGGLPEAARAALGHRVTAYLGLADDVAGFYAAARDDPAFAPVISDLHGYHQVRFPSPLENTVWAILAQRNPLALAARAKHALMDAFPENRAGGLTAFPDHAQLAGLGRDDLAALVRNERKAGHLHGALRVWGDLDEDALAAAPYDEARDALLTLPGVGPWSAAFILARGFGRADRLAFEKPLLAAAARVYGRTVTERDLRALAAPYGRFQGYWGHYLRVSG